MVVTVPSDGWLQLNPGSVGVYRVQYSGGLRTALQQGLATGQLGPRDRFGLQSDLFALARAGAVSSADVLRFTVAGYRNDTNFTVWQSLCSNLADIAVLVQHTDQLDAWKAFKLELLDALWQRLGWEDGVTKKDALAHNDSLLRALMLSQLGSANHPTVVQESLRRLRAHASGQEILKADIRAPVYATAQRHGDMEVFEILVKVCDFYFLYWYNLGVCALVLRCKPYVSSTDRDLNKKFSLQVEKLKCHWDDVGQVLETLVCNLHISIYMFLICFKVLSPFAIRFGYYNVSLTVVGCFGVNNDLTTFHFFSISNKIVH